MVHIISSSPDKNFNLSSSKAIAGDISKLKRTEKELEESEKKYRNLVESFPHSVSIFQDRKIVFWNSTCINMFKIQSPDEIIDRDISDWIPDKEKERILNYVRLREEGDQTAPQHFEADFQRDDGEKFTAEVFVSDITYKDRLAFQVVIMDITDRKRNEAELEKHRRHLEELVKKRTAELEKSEERYREIIEGTENLVTEVDVNGNFTFVNEASKTVFGLSPKDCEGKSAFDFIHKDDKERTRKDFTRWIKEKKENVTHENRQKSVDGKETDMLWTIRLHFDKDNKITSVKSIARDITELKKTKAQMKYVREIHDRLKNYLTTINGMLHLEEKRAGKVKEMTQCLPAFHDLITRIESFSNLHDLFPGEAYFLPIQIEDLCRKVVQEILKNAGKGNQIDLKTKSHPNEVKISSDQAFYLTLILNELTNNTLKYAMKERDRANIYIRIKQKEDIVNICYKDDGPGYPEHFLRNGFISSNTSFELIEGTIQHSLAGKVLFKNNKGAVVQFSFKNELNNKNKQ